VINGCQGLVEVVLIWFCGFLIQIDAHQSKLGVGQVILDADP
jgi:hypothetical protein